MGPIYPECKPNICKEQSWISANLIDLRPVQSMSGYNLNFEGLGREGGKLVSPETQFVVGDLE